MGVGGYCMVTHAFDHTLCRRMWATMRQHVIRVLLILTSHAYNGRVCLFVCVSIY